MLEALLRMAALMRKELLVALKDPASRVVLVMPVLLECVIFGYAATFDVKDVPYAVLDQSHSRSAAQFLAQLDGSGIFHPRLRLHSEAGIADAINTERVLMVVQIGPQFERQLLTGQSATVQVILDARNSTTAAVAGQYLQSIVERYNTERRTAAGMPPPPLRVQSRAWYNPNLETRWNFLPALLATLSLLQSLLLSALSVAREREQGTFDQLLVTPLLPVEIMIAKATPGLLIGLFQATLALLIIVFWFQVPMAGSLPALYAGLAIFTLAGIGIGLSVSALSATMQQAMLYTLVLMMPMMLLSGLTTPVANMSDFLQIATLLNPLRFGIDLVRRIYLEGVGLREVMPDILPLLLMSAVTLPLAAWLFRHRLV